MAWCRLVLLAILLLAARAGTATACSVDGEYVRPSNFELVQIADAIVIARPERRAGRGSDSRLVFRVEAAVKGAPPERVAFEDAELGRTQPSDLEDLSGSNPESHSGPCSRMTFSRARRYLLFLERTPDGGWQQLGFAFSRINEDYAGEDNAWMRSVRRYLRLQQTLAPMEQIAALRRMVETGRDSDGQPLSAAERTDIADHLGSISQWKPTPFLLDLFDRIERGAPLPVEPRPDAANGERGEVDRLVALATEGGEAPAAEGPRRERLMVLRALSEGDHPDALPLFDRLWADPDTDAAMRGIALRYFARNGQYSRAYQWIETRLLAELAALPDREALALLRDVARVQQGDSYEPGRERWRADPRAVAAWPELALALYRYQVRRFGRERTLSFRDALAAIDTSDYRVRPDLTVALAANFDPGALRWAVAELHRTSQNHGPGGGSGEEDPAWLPLRALAAAWSSNHSSLLIRTFCDGGERRRLVIRALGEDGRGLYRDLLGGMAAFPGLAPQEQSWLAAAVDRMTARERRDTGPINAFDYLAENPRPVSCRGRR
ncbi:MAG TPA: hypothetical protein VD887_04470 [Allosphingosinicella sp.]|nr:hypothetical protein [Allosphingosinicella sp.]